MFYPICQYLPGKIFLFYCGLVKQFRIDKTSLHVLLSFSLPDSFPPLTDSVVMFEAFQIKLFSCTFKNVLTSLLLRISLNFCQILYVFQVFYWLACLKLVLQLSLISDVYTRTKYKQQCSRSYFRFLENF